MSISLIDTPALPGEPVITSQAGNTATRLDAPEVPRLSGISPAEFEREYILKNRPAILTDAIAGWPALSKWTPQMFKERYAGREIEFKRSWVEKMQMGEFIDAVLASQPGKPAPYWTNNPVKELFPELLEDVSPFPAHPGKNWAVRHFFHPGMRHTLNRGAALELYIGGAGGSFPVLHWDGMSTHAWLMQVYGRKRYWAWAPDQTPYMYANEDPPNTSPIRDVENPDLEQYPLFAKARGCTFHLDPGEMLFVPSRWWHTARMDEPSITLSINTANRSNWASLSEDMLRKAHGLGRAVKAGYLGAAAGWNILLDSLSTL